MKMVIVMRKDLNMRKGKMASQAGHAVLEAFLSSDLERRQAWMKHHAQAKICVGVESEQELFNIRAEALRAGLNVGMIQDEGRTEFKEPTWTCLAIGPDVNERIDEITGHLKLL